MKVLLANLPWINNEEFYGVRAGSRWPHLSFKKESLAYYPFPFNLAYATSVLKKAGHNAIIKDCITEEMNEKSFIDFLKAEKPDVVVYETSTASIYNDWALTKATKEVLPNVKTVLCGLHVTGEPEESINQEFVDYVIVGEYEYALRELVDSISSSNQGRKNTKKSGEISILGIYSKSNEKIILPKERYPLIENIDELPYPARESLPMKKYIDAFCKNVPNVQMMTSRGCPYQCIFCIEPLFYGKGKYRQRSANSVVDEMEYLIKKYGVKEIYFDDSSFSVDQKRVIDICNEIKNRKLNVKWSCMADAKMELDTLKAMKDAGCVAAKFGVESASPEVLKRIKKHINLDHVRRVVKLCKKVGMETHATYIFGLPGETKKTIKETMDFAFRLNTDTAQFAIAIPYPGTTFYAEAKQEGWIKVKDWTDFDGRKVTIEYPGVSKKDLFKACETARKRIMLKVATNPRQLFQYLRSIYNYGGLKGVASNIYQKSKYLITGR